MLSRSGSIARVQRVDPVVEVCRSLEVRDVSEVACPTFDGHDLVAESLGDGVRNPVATVGDDFERVLWARGELLAAA